jgi:hypothetical protein
VLHPPAPDEAHLICTLPTCRLHTLNLPAP